jgi:hypothetical protein
LAHTRSVNTRSAHTRSVHTRSVHIRSVNTRWVDTQSVDTQARSAAVTSDSVTDHPRFCERRITVVHMKQKLGQHGQSTLGQSESQTIDSRTDGQSMSVQPNPKPFSCISLRASHPGFLLRHQCRSCVQRRFARLGCSVARSPHTRSAHAGSVHLGTAAYLARGELCLTSCC